MLKDTVFSKERDPKSPFVFDREVTNCFEDMLKRSIPFYERQQDFIFDFLELSLLRELQAKTALGGAEKLRLLDLGCSTGEMIIRFIERFPKMPMEAVLIDNSSPMLEKCEQRLNPLRKINPGLSFKFVEGDIENYAFEENAFHSIWANYTLQFVNPLKRKDILASIERALVFDSKGQPEIQGVFVFSEKLDLPHGSFFIRKMYEQFKMENGYSRLEVIQKRRALKNVLIPWSDAQWVEALRGAGLGDSDVLFRSLQFCTRFALKNKGC